MTIFGGVFALEVSRQIDARVCDELVRAISRDPTDRPVLHAGPGWVIAFVDLNLLPGEGQLVDPSGACSFLAGDIVLTPRSAASRCDDLSRLHSAWQTGSSDALLRSARGSFAVAHVDPARGRLRLAVDALGERSLYLAFSGHFVYFATALRILGSLTSLHKRLDVRGLLEMSSFGYALSTRTAYEQVELLDGGETVCVDRATGVSRYKYWDWNELRPSHLEAEELSNALYRAFREAVKWRLGEQSAALSLFSGGLDSRCVTAALRAEGATVHSINTAPEGSLDLVLGRRAAEHLGTRHFEYPRGPADGMERVVEAHRAWLLRPPPEKPAFPAAAWTGTGGSTGLGVALLDGQMVELMHKGRRSDAVIAFLRKNNIGLSPKPFQPGLRRFVEACCLEGALEQLHQHRSFDEGRRLHLFLMLNDQRRHLNHLYEDIDRYRLEMINPFFDTEFLRILLAAPVAPFVAHRFYNSWLKQFPFELDSVPWQAYVGHEPGPMPIPAGLRSQWEEGFQFDESADEVTDKLLARSRVALASAHFPAAVLRGHVIRIAWWATRTGIRDYSYLLKLASSWTDYAACVR